MRCTTYSLNFVLFCRSCKSSVSHNDFKLSTKIVPLLCDMTKAHLCRIASSFGVLQSEAELATWIRCMVKRRSRREQYLCILP